MNVTEFLTRSSTEMEEGDKVADLFRRARLGDRSALARLISFVEREIEVLSFVPKELRTEGTHSYLVGITGPPGAGKSTLTDRLVASYRGQDDEVAVLAIDPTSPYSGGAILGDRVRMQSHALDSKVYIRSMATRGSLGGLAVAVPITLRVLELASFNEIIVETVGVGQVEVDIVGSSDSTVVVLNPLWGDSIQANKAGLLEIADVFVVNKADRDGVRQTRRDLEAMLDLSEPKKWRPPIVETVASDGRGVSELVSALTAHREFLMDSGEIERKRQRRALGEFTKATLRLFERSLWDSEEFIRLHQRVKEGEMEPTRAAQEVIDRILRN